ncbi:hypothetical protein W97_03578, partial [Coniosporium apollinis CBS 100218]
EEVWEPVKSYRKVLSTEEDGSITVANVTFLENLYPLLNSGPDEYFPLLCPELVAARVKGLVAQEGAFPIGRGYNFWGDNPLHTAY